MDISVFDLFKIGIGPSSSHTVGPMLAALRFVKQLSENQIESIDGIKVDLYGSLALTGVGHGTDKAIFSGLEGEHPSTIDPDQLLKRYIEISRDQALFLDQKKSVKVFIEWHHQEVLPKHTNGMRFTAYQHEAEIVSEVFYSVGGGFIVTEAEFDKPQTHRKPAPYCFESASELFQLCQKNHLTVAELMLENEKTWRSEKDVKEGILTIAAIMEKCIQRGLSTTGILPGGLKVERRASKLYLKLKDGEQNSPQKTDIFRWLDIWAMAVNEENADGGRVVTAPTNGAAGIIPSVLKYYRRYCQGNDAGVITFLLTATAIGALYKKRASISGAEVGCQGEVGVSCSMAAGALAAALGGSLAQIENAAEIGMEHNLGLTCDPVMGLVQIPCIERNAMASVKAVNAAEIALLEDGANKISLDQVIDTMKRTGKDMMVIYKETSLGGLAAAVNVPEC